MTQDTGTAKFIRGLVKFVFIACYVAFMWASIHHVATFFNNFEEGTGDIFGSYLLAGAFDLTALVTTIGVMFFRKSMPGHVQIILWAFIIAIAGYSFFINWEYAAHFQTASLILQPTGDTTPVFDKAGVLHYVPAMKENTELLIVNPLLASGFTVFSLIYSVVAEFFGTKPPTVKELQDRKTYLEETESVVERIKTLESKGKGKGLIQSAKEKALELRNAVEEVTKKDEVIEDTAKQPERNTDKLIALGSQEIAINEDQTLEESTNVSGRKKQRNDIDTTEVLTEDNLPPWLATGGSTISLKTVVEHTKISIVKLRNRVESKAIRCTRNKEVVYKDSLIAWLKVEGLLIETSNTIQSEPAGNDEENTKQVEESPVESETQGKIQMEEREAILA